MGQVAGNLGEFSLGSLNDTTGWIPLDNTIADIAFTISGTFVGTILLDVSNQNDYVKTRFTNIATSYSGIQAPLGIPRELGRFIRFRMSAYVSGTAYVGLSKGKNADGRLVDMIPQSNSSSPSDQFNS